MKAPIVQETDLIAQLKRGDSEAFKRLVDLYQVNVFNTCYGFVHHQQDAEDLSQEVFIQIFKSIKDFREDSSLRTWIYRIAVTKSLELIRKRKREKRKAFFKSLLNTTDKIEEREDNQFFVPPGIAMENKERAEALFAAIQSLPQNQRIAFTLNQIEDLSYMEVAQVMETSQSSVESLLYRARTNLKTKLYHYYENR